MTYKEKLTSFVEDLNTLLSDDYLFPKQERGRFVLSIEQGLLGDGNGGSIDCDKILLVFSEKGFNHPIYLKTITSDNAYKLVYFEILRDAFLSIDAVGQMKDVYENDVNVLSFQTMLTSGLEKIKNK